MPPKKLRGHTTITTLVLYGCSARSYVLSGRFAEMEWTVNAADWQRAKPRTVERRGRAGEADLSLDVTPAKED